MKTISFTIDMAKTVFFDRNENSHKGDFGRVVIIGGSKEYSGAVKLAGMATASLRSGCGLSSLAIPSGIVEGVMPYVLENTIIGLPDRNGHIMPEESELINAIKGANSVAIGMGMGRYKEAGRVVKAVLNNAEGKVVIDADGINALCDDVKILKGSNAKITITPHVAEFSRLTGAPIKAILEEPIKYASEFSKEYGVTVLLKGHTTIVCDGDNVYSVTCGTAGMSKGGSGDVLSGIIAGINAFSKCDNALNAVVGAYIAGSAGERAMQKYGEYSMLASDEIKEIAFVIKDLHGR